MQLKHLWVLVEEVLEVLGEVDLPLHHVGDVAAPGELDLAEELGVVGDLVGHPN